MKKKNAAALVAALALTTAACGQASSPVAPNAGITGSLRSVTYDVTTGVGFVGKGDVQLTFGWNNAQLQNNMSAVRFRVSSSETSEVSWVCTNTNNEKTQERSRTTTSSYQGVFSSIARVKNQVTGFNLTGYAGAPTVVVGATEGNTLNSCPNSNGTWVLTTPAGDPVVTQGGGGLEVSIDGTTWLPIVIPPVI